MAPPDADDRRLALLALSLTRGLGRVRVRRLIEACQGDPRAALRASASRLRSIRGIGEESADAIATALTEAPARAGAEMERAASIGASLITVFDDDYPSLLAPLPDAPLLLWTRGRFGGDIDRYALSVVGSRSCTPYGLEQADRFAMSLAQRGLTIVSGGARGVDTAAHRGALRAPGRTVVVLGCGLARCYPPENAPLFEEVVEAGGALVSELPLTTEPTRENFPARNRIISGLSLGVLVIEAGAGSGALITARQAVEEHGREVMALPGRVDSSASAGSLELIRSGGAALVTSPADVLETLLEPARRQHEGTHAIRYTPAPKEAGVGGAVGSGPVVPPSDLTTTQSAIIEALSEPLTLDELVMRTGLGAAVLRADVTVLEVRSLVRRRGDRLERGVIS